MKKWVKRSVIGAALLLGALVLFAAGSLPARYLAARIARRDFPPPGRILDANGRTAHIFCTGTGSPTIVLESGLDDRGSWSWSGVQPELAQISRVCAYDRAGILWSAASEGPRDAERMTEELHSLLGAASEAPPYVLVGHSLGGLLVRVYDQRFPREVAGFVFVDSSHPDQEARFPAEVRQRAAQTISRLPPRWVSVIGANYLGVVEHGNPPIAYRWHSLSEVRREIDAWATILSQASRAGPIGNRPSVVLTAGAPTAMPGVSDTAASEMRETWLALQEELRDLSTNSDHRIVAGAGHYVQVDRPESVVTAVRDVVVAVRDQAQVRRDAR